MDISDIKTIQLHDSAYWGVGGDDGSYYQMMTIKEEDYKEK